MIKTKTTILLEYIDEILNRAYVDTQGAKLAHLTLSELCVYARRKHTDVISTAIYEILLKLLVQYRINADDNEELIRLCDDSLYYLVNNTETKE
jgi:hypothetical protein